MWLCASIYVTFSIGTVHQLTKAIGRAHDGLDQDGTRAVKVVQVGAGFFPTIGEAGSDKLADSP
jgi:hypothetical protein